MCAASIVTLMPTTRAQQAQPKPAVAAAAAIEGIRATVEGKLFVAADISASAFVIAGKPFLNVNGNFRAKPGAPTASLGFNIAGRTPGTYAFVPNSVTSTHGRYTRDLVGADPMLDVYLFDQGSVTISSYNAANHTVSGTFSVIAKNRSGSPITISDGIFSDVAVVDVAR